MKFQSFFSREITDATADRFIAAAAARPWIDTQGIDADQWRQLVAAGLSTTPTAPIDAEEAELFE